MDCFVWYFCDCLFGQLNGGGKLWFLWFQLGSLGSGFNFVKLFSFGSVLVVIVKVGYMVLLCGCMYGDFYGMEM